MPDPASTAGSPTDSAQRTRASLLLFAGSFLAFAFVYTKLALIFDADSYFHLAIAREYAAHGIVRSLEWARFSVMHTGYGDKELLFHVLLAPFAAIGSADLGGKLALAFFNALLAATLGSLGARAHRHALWLAPLLVFGLCGSFDLRVLRLRPELLALLILLWATLAASQQRHRMLGALAFAFALSYTAFHALLGLCLLWFVWEAWAERRFSPGLLLYPVLGVCLALCLHPDFPANLRIWEIQNIEFFRYKDVLDAGSEIRPQTTRDLLFLDWAWYAGLAWVMWTFAPRAATGPAREAVPPPATAYFALAALAFGLLTLQMARFALYFAPFTTLALLFERSRRGLVPGRRLRLPGGRDAPALLGAPLAALGMLSVTANLYVNLAAAGSLTPALRDELVQLGHALPKGARVAASWQDAEHYSFFAPQARYLNVLDPVFMQVAGPERHALWQSVLEGEHPDLPLAIGAGLDSEYLAFAVAGRAALQERLRDDPRVELLRSGAHALYRIKPAANEGFIRRFDVQRERSGRRDARPMPYPWLDAAHAASLEGFVDGARVDAASCLWFAHTFQLSSEARRVFQLASYGPSVLFIDNVQRVQVAAGRALLSQAVVVPTSFAPGSHEIMLRSCPSRGRSGFYLRDLSTSHPN